MSALKREMNRKWHSLQNKAFLRLKLCILDFLMHQQCSKV